MVLRWELVIHAGYLVLLVVWVVGKSVVGVKV
jgi:hypothetical protein